MAQNKNYKPLQKNYQPGRPVKSFNTIEATPRKGAVKNPNQTNQTTPLASNPHRKNNTKKQWPTKAPYKKNNNPGKGAHNRNKKHYELKKPVIVKVEKKGWAPAFGLQSRIFAFLDWSWAFTKKIKNKKTAKQKNKKTAPQRAPRKLFPGYQRKGASRERITVRWRRLRASVATYAANPRRKKKEDDSKPRPVAIGRKTPLAISARYVLDHPKKPATLTFAGKARKDAGLLKSFTAMLTHYAANSAREETRYWKMQQRRRIASWYARNYRPHRQRAWLDVNLFNNIMMLKRKRSPTETLTLMLLNKIKLARWTRGCNDTAGGEKFLKKVTKVQKRFNRWFAKPVDQRDEKGLNDAIRPFLGAADKKMTATETRLMQLFWLFVSPEVKLIHPLPLDPLRPVGYANRLKNLWRKPVPRVYKKGARDKLISAVENKINLICGARRRLNKYSISVAELYAAEKLRLRMREPRAGRSKDLITRRLTFRRRPRKPFGRRYRRKVMHRTARRARRRRLQVYRRKYLLGSGKIQKLPKYQQRLKRVYIRLRKLQQKRNRIKKVKSKTAPAVMKRPTSTKMLTLSQRMNTTFSRFYSTKIYKPAAEGLETPKRRRVSIKKRKITQRSLRKQIRLTKVKTRARRNLQKVLRSNAGRIATKPSIAFAPKFQRELRHTRVSPYVLRTKRVRRKLKKFGPTKQSVFTVKNRPVIRRFIRARILTVESGRLASVRRSSKAQTTANLLKTGRDFDKARPALYSKRRGKAPVNATSYASWVRSKKRAESSVIRLSDVRAYGKFTQRWQTLQRASANKRRAWKTLLHRGLNNKLKSIRRRTRSKLFQRARRSKRLKRSRVIARKRLRSAKEKKKSVKPQKKSISKSRRKAKYAVTKNRISGLRRARGKQLRLRAKKKTPRKRHLLRVRNRKPLIAALIATALRARRAAVGNLGGAGLKKHRRERKRFFRLRVKRSINRRRRRWFKRSVKRVRRRRKPSHMKPWLPGPRNRLFALWAKAATKKTRLRTGKKRLVLRGLRKRRKVLRCRVAKLRLKRKSLKKGGKWKGPKKVPTRFEKQTLPSLARLRQLSGDTRPRTEARERTKAKLRGTPYFALHYRLRDRLRSRKNRKGITKKEQTGWKTVNRRRLAQAAKLQRRRRAVNAKQKQQLKPLKTLAVVTRAERRRRAIGSLKRNRGKIRLKNKRYISYPAATGVYRRRRVFNALAGTEVKTRGLLHRTAAQMCKKLVQFSPQQKLLARIRRNSIKLISRGSTRKSVATQAKRAAHPRNREVLKTKTRRSAPTRTRSLHALRPRLPATGRTKNTFDALLRKYYSKNIPVAYKKKTTKRTTPLLHTLSATELRSVFKLETQAQLRQSAAAASNIKGQAFYSVVERKQARIKGLKASDHFGKFGFAKSRSKVEVKAVRAAHYKRQGLRGVHLGSAETLLQLALTGRRFTRRARKLAILGRRNTRHYIIKTRPFWLKWRHAKKQRRARVAKRYAAPQDARFGRPVFNKWTMNELKVGFSRRRARTPAASTVQGEALLVQPVVRRLYRLEYKLRELAKKKRRLLAKTTVKRKRRALRVRKKKMHRGLRRLREVFTKFRRHKKRALKKLKLWRLRKRYRLERRNKRRLKKRLNYKKSVRPVTLNAVTSLLERVNSEKQKLQSARKDLRPHSTLLTALHFKKPARYTANSVEENKKWQKHIQAVRKQKYRRLTEVSEALTTIMPRLISLFLGQTVGTDWTNEQGKRAVKAAYWNLRLFLLHARRASHTKMEDSYDKLQTVRKELTLWSNYRFFTTSDVKKTKYRFQPYAIMPAPSLRQGADGWLDQFLPQYYDLLLEDPEKYGHFRMTPIQVFRAHPSVKAVRTWETRANPSTMEMQFKRLTNGSYGQSSNRFETMLMTTRRYPAVNGYGAVAESQVINPVGRAVKKTSFFKRQFSSSSRPTVAFTRFLIKERNTESTEDAAATVTLLRSYKSLKERAVAKSRSRQTTEFGLEGAGALDPRLARLKSARSEEFVERLGNQAEIVQEGMISRRAVRAKHLIGTVRDIHRDTRRLSLTRTSSTEVLANIRTKAALRRAPTFARNDKRNMQKTFGITQQARLRGKEYESAPGHLARKVYKAVRVNTFNSNMKNILHRRNAWCAKNKVEQATSPVIPPEVFQLKRHLRNRAYKHDLKTRVKRKLWKNARSLLRDFYLFKMQARALGRKNKTKVSFLQVRASKKKLMLPRNFLVTAPHQNKFGKFATTAGGLTRVKTERKSLQKNFVKTFLELRKARRKINKALQKKIARKNVSPWASRRKELWHQLTHKWMKKRRILRRWLKGIKRSFKEKTHWTFEGEHALPEELFKLSRIRLRKLTWRKSDGRFEYPGLKKKLTLRPEEHRRTPWLEGMLYTRALYSTNRMPIRRRQLPKDVKSKKWLQKAKKQLFKKAATHLYIRKRQWPRLRMYNQRLQRSLFWIRNTKAAVKRFQKLTRRTAQSRIGGDAFAKGNLNRVDVNLTLLNFAPTTFWARSMTAMGLVQINGKPVTHKDARLLPGDTLTWNHGMLAILKDYFNAPLKRWEKKKERELAGTVLEFPSNFEYNVRLGYATYLRHPGADDLRLNGRINHYLFKWFRLDSRLGK